MFENSLIQANTYTIKFHFAGYGMLVKIEPLSCDLVFYSLVLKMQQF